MQAEEVTDAKFSATTDMNFQLEGCSSYAAVNFFAVYSNGPF